MIELGKRGRIAALVLGLALALAPCLAEAQTAALLPNGEQTFVDLNGTPFAGGKVYFYIPSTTTPKTTWSDPGETTPNTNPVVLDGAGRAVIYGSGQYSELLKDSQGNTIWNQLTQDAISAASGKASGSSGQLQYNSSGNLAGVTLAGDCTFTSPNIICLSTNGVPFGTASGATLGTSGATLGLLNSNKTDSGNNVYSGTTQWTGSIIAPFRLVTATSPVTVSATTDYFVCLQLASPTAVTVNLPTGSVAGQTFLIKDCAGNAQTDNVTIQPASGTIDGQSTYVMSVNWQSVAVTYDGTNWELN